MRKLIPLLLLAAVAQAQGHPRDKEIKDAATRAWWHTTEALSGDSMEGRDTGSLGYLRAASYVQKRFQSAGLQPLGTDRTYFQDVPMHEVAVEPEGTRFTLLHQSGTSSDLRFLYQITISPAAALPNELEASVTFRGYCGKEATQGIAGKFVLCFGTQRQGLSSAAERVANVREGKGAGIINIDDPYFTLEPPRWPAAYARGVTIDDPHPSASLSLPIMRLSSEALAAMLEGTGKDTAELLRSGGGKQALTSFDLPTRLRLRLRLTARSYSSPNVLAVLPGSDPLLSKQYVVLAAHLDGYGYGTPVEGDSLYNGALDDAAYVALLIQFADDVRRSHRTFARSILFCAFTGEEKGLLGANFFVDHPPVPLAQLAADLNLDQLRPLFPLKLLTALAVDDSSLGAMARAVGATMDIRIRADPEPERGLLRRADHFPFLRMGVPAIGFIFGYEPGTDEERRYREWYQVRYHRPQDDLTQPIDFVAAAKFNRFFEELVASIANVRERPAFLAGSPYARKP